MEQARERGQMDQMLAILFHIQDVIAAVLVAVCMMQMVTEDSINAILQMNVEVISCHVFFLLQSTTYSVVRHVVRHVVTMVTCRCRTSS